MIIINHGYNRIIIKVNSVEFKLSQYCFDSFPHNHIPINEYTSYKKRFVFSKKYPKRFKNQELIEMLSTSDYIEIDHFEDDQISSDLIVFKLSTIGYIAVL